MVSFVWDVCGDSVKKNRVDKHCETKCRNAWVFTWLECGKVFEGYENILKKSHSLWKQNFLN